MSYEASASALATGVNSLVAEGTDADEALHVALGFSSLCSDTQADLYARISEAWGGVGLLWKATVQRCMEAVQ